MMPASCFQVRALDEARPRKLLRNLAGHRPGVPKSERGFGARPHYRLRRSRGNRARRPLPFLKKGGSTWSNLGQG